jgi:hypothetical protein
MTAQPGCSSRLLSRHGEVISQAPVVSAPAAAAPSASTAQPTVAHPPLEVRVINRVPATFLYVMREQFDLMKRWLEPLTRITADQDEQMRTIRQSMDQILSRYDDIIRRLESSEGEQDDVGA